MHVLLADVRVCVRQALRLFVEEALTIDRMWEVADVKALFQFTAIERPDLILLDTALAKRPRADSLQHCIGTLQILHPPVYIIVLCSNEESSEEMRTSGADAWVCKGESPAYLLAALQQAATDLSGCLPAPNRWLRPASG